MEFQPATEADVIAGVVPKYVAAPASAAEASIVLQTAAQQGLAVTVRGSGTKQDWAAPPSRLDLVIDTGKLTGIVEHAAGDLVVVVRAGTTMDMLQGKLSEAGQQLALDAPFPGSTVGGTVAANVSGPRRLAYGTVRDLLIGVTIVRPDGVIAKAGGKVVKNVAGYDLGKLFTGSYGTLGLITECAFRLHPLPANSVYVRLPAYRPAALAQLAPSAVEVDAPPGRAPEYVALFEGDAAAARAAAFTPCERPPWWNTYPWSPGDVGIKATAALSKVPALLEFAAANGIHLRGSAATGVLYATLPSVSVHPHAEAATASVGRLREAVHEAGGFLTVVTAPAGMQLDRWGPVPGLELMRRIKHQFDPAGLFAPGRFVGGI